MIQKSKFITLIKSMVEMRNRLIDILNNSFHSGCDESGGRTLGRGTLGRGTLGREQKTRVDSRSGDLHRVDSRSGAP